MVAFLRRIDPRILIAATGVLLAAGVLLTDDRDPVVFTIPILVATTIIVLAVTLAGSGSEAARLERDAAGLGLSYEGLRSVPPVTSILQDVRTTSPVARGPLDPGGPDVRLTRHGGRLVAITDAPAEHLDPAARELLDGHPLHPQAEIEQRLLVVAVDGDVPLERLLEVTRELHARLEVLAFSG